MASKVVFNPFTGNLDFTGADASGSITASGYTMSTARLLGRNTAGTGAIEQITLGTNLSFSGTTLNAAGGSMAIGGSITSATEGSVLFAGASGVLAQDNTNLFWDDTNNRLGIGTTTLDYKVEILTSGYQPLRIRSSDDDPLITIGSQVASSQYWTFGASSNTSGQGANRFMIGTSDSAAGSFSQKMYLTSTTAVINNATTINSTLTVTGNGLINGLTLTNGLNGGTRALASASPSAGSFTEWVLTDESGGLAGFYKNGTTRVADGGADAFNFYNDTGVMNMRAGGNINFLTGSYPGTNRMTITSSTGYVGVGVSNPSVHFHLSDADVTTAASLLPSGLVFFSTAQTANNDFYLITAHNTESNFFACTRAKGTLASPTAVVAGNQIGAFIFNMYDGASVKYLVAAIRAEVNAAANGGNLIFGASTSNGGTDRYWLLSDGSFGNHSAPVYPLHIVGNGCFAGQLRVGVNIAGAINSSNFGLLQVTSAQNTAASFTVTQNNVATGHHGFKATSSIYYIGTDGPTLAVMSNPTNAFTGTEIARFDLTNTRFGVGVTPLATAHFQATTEQLRLSYDSSNRLSVTVSSAGAVTFDAVGSGAAFTFSDKVSVSNPVNLKGYTVATLPAGVTGDVAYVTDALAPSFLVTIVGGGSVVTPVFYNGANWVAQ